MPSNRRSAVPSIALLLGLAACSGTPPKDAPDEPKPDVQPEPDAKPEPPDEPRPIGALYGGPEMFDDRPEPPPPMEPEVEEPKPDAPDDKDGKDAKKKAEPKE
jgi:hypothetical protein